MTDRPIPESIMREAEFAYDVAFDLGPEVIARALMARDERAASAARVAAQVHIDRCNRIFNHGDQGSAILERAKAEALKEFANAILSEEQ